MLRGGVALRETAGVQEAADGPDAPAPVEGLEVVSRRRYGDTTLIFLRPGPEQEQEP